jgi:hypothetical protein
MWEYGRERVGSTCYPAGVDHCEVDVAIPAGKSWTLWQTGRVEISDSGLFRISLGPCVRQGQEMGYAVT